MQSPQPHGAVIRGVLEIEGVGLGRTAPHQTKTEPHRRAALLR